MIDRWKCAAVLLALALAGAGGVHAMSADELVAKNLEARGGAGALAAIKTLKAEGRLRLGGDFELHVTSYQKAPDSLRNEASLQGMTAVQAWDGREAWQISPFQGRKEAEKMSAEDARELSDDAPIGGLLFDYQARGSKVESLGSEDVDGTDAHKLKVTLRNGDVAFVYLDPDQFLEIRVVNQRSVRGTQVESTSDYGDYEQVANVYFPFSISTSRAGGERQQLSIDHAEANGPMADALFAFPATTTGVSP